jgi:mRNA-degrading endonuclease RelE of RelBE toxin-antitoxin system
MYPVFIFNTEPYHINKISFEIDNLYLLPSGFKRFFLTYQLKPKKIFIYDINLDSINFNKQLDDLDTIDVKKIKNIINENEDKDLAFSTYNIKKNFDNMSSGKKLSHNWKVELTRWADKETLDLAFNYYKSIEKEYIQVDLVEDYNKIFDINKVNALWYSNIWNYSHINIENMNEKRRDFDFYLKKNNIVDLK